MRHEVVLIGPTGKEQPSTLTISLNGVLLSTAEQASGMRCSVWGKHGCSMPCWGSTYCSDTVQSLR